MTYILTSIIIYFNLGQLKFRSKCSAWSLYSTEWNLSTWSSHDSSIHSLLVFAGYQGFPAQAAATAQAIPTALAATAGPHGQALNAAGGVSLTAGGQLQVGGATSGLTYTQQATLSHLPAAVPTSSGPVCIQEINPALLSQPALCSDGNGHLTYVLNGTASALQSPGSRLTNGTHGIKRKLCSVDSESDSGDSTGKPGEGENKPVAHQPLYCKVCRVTLNAPAQAKQHYEGKTHAKKAKLYADALEAEKLTPSCVQKSSSQVCTLLFHDGLCSLVKDGVWCDDLKWVDSLIDFSECIVADCFVVW